MASGDKLLDAVTVDAERAVQGSLLSPITVETVNPSSGGMASLFGSAGGLNFRIVIASGGAESAIPDFDVEKQYLVTVEEV